MRRPGILCAQALHLTEQFYRWERRGRGYDIYPQPIELEPPFTPFGLSVEAPTMGRDSDGRRPTLLSRLTDNIASSLREPSLPAKRTRPAAVEPAATPDDSSHPMREFMVVMPRDGEVSVEAAEHLLTTLPRGERPLAFEIIGTFDHIEILFACEASQSEALRSHLASHFHEAAVMPVEGRLRTRWNGSPGDSVLLAEYGLSGEFMIPLRSARNLKVDPVGGIASALSHLDAGEVGVLQVLLTAVRQPWAENVHRAVLDEKGSPFFLDAPEVTAQAREKISKPLFACIIRVAGRSPDQERALAIVRGMGFALNALANPPGNKLIPLSNAGYFLGDHEQDLLERRSRRTGMILGSGELASLVHPPAPSVRSAKLVRQVATTRAAPAITIGRGHRLGWNEHGGQGADVTLSEEQRSRHMYVVGVSGTGKSTLLLSSIVQDLKAGAGLAVLDPHGDLIDDIVRRCPEERLDDVILLDPSDAEYPIGFNVLTAHTELERTLLSSDLVSVFRRLSTSWGDQMTSVLGNAIQAILESDRGGTLLDLRRFLVEAGFRKEFLRSVRDPEIVYFWEREFPLLAGKPQAPLLTRLDTFLRPRTIRYMVAQKESRLDFRKVMDDGKVLLCRLSQGAIGEENAYLLGTLLVSKLQQTAISRQDVAAADRRPFYLYIDEFQNFVTPSMEAILSGARKYGLGMVLAHQEMRQIGSKSPEVLSSVLSNPYTRVCFRVGDDDARRLAEGFAHFTQSDVQSLGIGQAIARVERSEYDFNLRTDMLPPTEPVRARVARETIVARTRERYSVGRAEVESTIGSQEFRMPAKAAVESSTPSDVQPTPPLPIGVSRSTPSTIRRKEPSAAPPPADAARPGRGGAQHKYLQELVRRWGEAAGWSASCEEPVLGGHGHVDVALRRGEDSVAVEISVTTEAPHEIQNIRKCLTAGFGCVILCTPDERSATLLEAHLATDAADIADRASVVVPAGLIERLSRIESAEVAPQDVRGYRVRVRMGQATRNQQSVVAKIVSGALHRLKGKK